MQISFKKHEIFLILEALSMLEADHCDHQEGEEVEETRAEINNVRNKIFDALNKNDLKRSKT